MSAGNAELFWTAVSVYAAIGALVAFGLMAGLFSKIDQIAAAAPWRVKLLWTPGLVALWPVVAYLLVSRRTEVGP